MTVNEQFQHVQEATSDEVNSSSETTQTVADSLITLQDYYLRFAQSLFQTWREMLTLQTQSMPRVQTWQQSTRQQPEAFQRLTSSPLQLYRDFLLAPFTLSRKLVEASMTTTQREREPVEASMIATQRERELVP